MQIQELPGLESTLEEQELARRKFLPGHTEIPLKQDMLTTCALFLPSWEDTRAKMAIHMKLPELSDGEEEMRAGLPPKEQLLLFDLETTVKRRLTGYEVTHYLGRLRKQQSEEAAQAEELKRLEESSKPIHLPDRAEPLSGCIGFRFRLEDSVMIPQVNVALEAGDYSGEIKLTHKPPAPNSDWHESELRSDFTMTLADGRRIVANCNLVLCMLADLEKPAFSERAVAWREAPLSWHEAMGSRCLASGLQVIDDGRSRFCLSIAGRRHVVMTKYLSYCVDLALDEEAREIIVRVQGLLAEKWKGDPFSGDEDAAEFQDYEGVEPFATSIPVERLVPMLAPELHVDASSKYVIDGMPPQYRLG